MAFEVFISYSHRDQKLRKELEKHLSNLKLQNVIISWGRVGARDYKAPQACPDHPPAGERRLYGLGLLLQYRDE